MSEWIAEMVRGRRAIKFRNSFAPFRHVRQKGIQTGISAGEMAEGVTAQLVSFTEQLLQVISLKQASCLTRPACQPHRSVVSAMGLIRPEDRAPHFQSGAGEVIKGERNSGLPVRKQGVPPL